MGVVTSCTLKRGRRRRVLCPKSYKEVPKGVQKGELVTHYFKNDTTRDIRVKKQIGK